MADDRIAVHFDYEWHDAGGQWFRSYSNENWRFDRQSYMAERHASINDLPIDPGERIFHWPAPATRQADHPA